MTDLLAKLRNNSNSKLAAPNTPRAPFRIKTPKGIKVRLVKLKFLTKAQRLVLRNNLQYENAGFEGHTPSNVLNGLAISLAKTNQLDLARQLNNQSLLGLLCSNRLLRIELTGFYVITIRFEITVRRAQLHHKGVLIPLEPVLEDEIKRILKELKEWGQKREEIRNSEIALNPA